MSTDLLTAVEQFQFDTGLSDHRIGILIANNGRLLDRLRSGGRVWPETEAEIRKRMLAERSRRDHARPTLEQQEGASR